MDGIIRALEGVLQAEVIDRTSRPGRFDVDLTLTPADPAVLREALRRQFGLRLEPMQASGETLVVLNAEMPAN